MSDANPAEGPITVPKWKLVCLLKALLKVEDPNAQRKKSQKHHRPGEAPEKSSRKASESFQKPLSLGWEYDPFHSMSYMARVLNMATQLSITHRWDGNVKLFSALARQISHCPVVIWKVGAQCLSNHPDGRDDLLRPFAKTMVEVGRIAAPEILFDYVTHLISIGEYQEAKAFIHDYQGKCRHKVPQDVRNILQGFRGMLEYIEWFQKKNAKDNDDDIPGNQLAAIGTETEIAVHADRAIVHFNNFKGCQENCDTFIAILTEILEYYNRIDELEKVLQSYLQFNEIHPSPCIFMYEFLKKHYPTDVDRQRYILQELALICPSHPNILSLCKLIPEQEFIKSVMHLACLVDYEEWRNDLQAWKQLALTLTSNAINCRDKSHYHTLHTLWTDRSLWWPAYHFQLENINVHDQESAELSMFKAIVIATMFNSEHPYIMMVKEMLEVGKWENELTYLIMKLEIADHLNQLVKSKLAEKSRNPAADQFMYIQPENMFNERRPRQPVVNQPQNRTNSTLTADSQNLVKQTVQPSQHTWKVAKKSKKSKVEHPQGKNKVHKIIIRKSNKTRQPLTRRGRPAGNGNGNCASSTSSSSSTTSSSDESSDEPSSSRHLAAMKGRPSKNAAGMRNAYQPLVKSRMADALNTANGTISKNQAIKHAKPVPQGISKQFISSSDSDSDDEPPVNGVRHNQESVKSGVTPARATVPLKRKITTASDKANQLTNKKTHSAQSVFGQVVNFNISPTQASLLRNSVTDKLPQNYKTVSDSSTKDKPPNQDLRNVPAPSKTPEEDLTASKAPNILSSKNVNPKNVNTSNNTSKDVVSSNKKVPESVPKSTRTRTTDLVSKPTKQSNILPADRLIQLNTSKNASDRSLGTNDKPLKVELISPTTTDCEEVEEPVQRSGHTLEWKGKSLHIHTPVKLKKVTVVLERINIQKT